MNVTRTKCSITMQKVSKTQISKNFGTSIEHSPHWILLFSLSQVKKIDTLEAYIKFGTKLFHLTWEKRVKCKACHGKKIKKKVNLGVLMFQRGYPNHAWTQCVYFAFRTIVFSRVLLQKQKVFIKRNFQTKSFETFYLLNL
jgi:uncharacterized UBP type Zn finger protein